MASPPKAATLRRRLGAELRRLREAAGLNIEQAGAVIYGSDSKISRLENGRGALKPLEIQALLVEYGADVEQRDRLMRMVHEADQPEPWAHYQVPAGLETLLGLEADAHRLDAFSASIIYGLLQTERYARVTIQEGRFDEQDSAVTEGLVALRMHRQQILSRPEPCDLTVVLDEGALRRHVGGSDVMREQIGHLIEVSDHTRASLHVLAFDAGAHAGQTGSFLKLSFPDPDDADLVYCDGAAGNQYVKKPALVHRFASIFDRLLGRSLSTAETRRFLNELYKEYRS